MEHPTRLRLLVSLFLGAVLIAGAAILLVRLNTRGSLEIVLPTPTTEATEIKVYVSGAVSQPGVYTLRPGDRLDEAVRAAGGPSSDADLLAINLATRLHDEQQVIVPTRQPGVATGTRATPSPATLLDINTASAQALDALPGIGPELAAAIVRYRDEHGPFPNVESLIAVPGIGPKRMADVRPLIVAR
jgi:competence protein ComEA